MSRLTSSLLVGAALFCGLAGAALRADSGLCARVVIQINQQATLERQGFVATLAVDNGQPSSLDAFSVTLNFTDANGNPVGATTSPNGSSSTNLFFYTVQTGYTIPTSIAGGSSQTLAYFIVPAAGAAGTSAQGSLYYVGATIQYSVNGTPQTVQVAPASITVQPMPQLQLQYFLPGDVYGQDPFSQVSDPEVPFPLGVRVINTSSSATARQVAIQSGQPEIIDNKAGLLIDFRIVGCQVNGAPAQPSLLVNFGDIAPNSVGIADWVMVCSLSGTFEKFDAQISHDPSLGGSLTSLIPQSAVSTYRLIGVVLCDLPGRDTVPDFLAVDPTADSNAWNDGFTDVQLFESELTGQTHTTENEPVNYLAPGNPAVNVNNSVLTVNLAGSSPLLYVRTTSPISADQNVSAVRSDGKKLASANCWVSKTENGSSWVYWLNLFDTGVQPGAQSYTLTFSNPTNLTAPPALIIVGGPNFQFLINQPTMIKISATDADGLFPVLSTANLPDGAIFTDNKDGTGELTWTPSATQVGSYSVQFRATDGPNTTAQSAQVQVAATLTSGFSAWQSKYWPGITDPNIIGPYADPSGGGLDNLLEYALGGDPTKPDDSILPVAGVDVVGGQHFLTLTYRQLQGDPTLLYEVVASNDLSVPLANWTVQIQAEPTDQSAAPPGFMLVKVRDSVPIEGGSIHRFLKLRVTQTSN
jgi:hypothetical protein